MTSLVVAAHPDDEVLGCGATMAQSRGFHVGILGEGITSRLQWPRGSIERLHEAADRARRLLGVESLWLESLPDNRFDTVGLLEIVRKIEVWIAEIRPDVVYTHHASDLNVDHRLTLQAVLAATRPCSKTFVPEVYSFDVPSATDWSFGQLGFFAPNIFVEVSERALQVKLDAMQAYASEAREFPHPRSPEALRAAATRWGSVAGVRLAEPFVLVRSIRSS